MEKAINRQRVLLQHLQPISSSSSSLNQGHESTLSESKPSGGFPVPFGERDNKRYSEVVAGSPQKQDSKSRFSQPNLSFAPREDRVLEVEMESEVKEVLVRSLICEVKKMEYFDDLSDFCLAVGLSNFSIKYLGGLEICLTLENLETTSNILKDPNHGVRQWLWKIRKWEKDFEPQGKLAWLSIIGVPVHLWTRSVFTYVAERWGQVVDLKNCSLLDAQSLVVGKVLIQTSGIHQIEEVLKIKSGGSYFTVRVSENVKEILELNTEVLSVSNSDDESVSLDDEVNNSDHDKCSLDKECDANEGHENVVFMAEDGDSSAPDLQSDHHVSPMEDRNLEPMGLFQRVAGIDSLVDQNSKGKKILSKRKGCSCGMNDLRKGKMSMRVIKELARGKNLSSCCKNHEAPKPNLRCSISKSATNKIGGSAIVHQFSNSVSTHNLDKAREIGEQIGFNWNEGGSAPRESAQRDLLPK
ncbi:hypothetical protein L6452_39333 [Arctium lappa]|uniref:Uncharacterized protein n=1 Tax=Arctium lappa TaxID=4217 RepID=A0ACB8XTP4_ARCLA|nr:hypothetical protein L6452_39333 [Arctium lappa]